MQIIGKETIRPVLFYSGKILGYITWILLLISIIGILNIRSVHNLFIDIASFIILSIGIGATFISLVNLGNSTRLGLPTEKLEFKNKGLYRVSRNPMYIGFDLITIASMIYHLNIIIIAFGIYSIVIYHLIILSEEKYMEKEYRQAYIDYKSRVKRYI